jgi:hypothetical protein
MTPITILFAGDYSPVIRTEKLALESKFDLIFNDTRQQVIDSDMAVVGLECTITSSGIPLRKTGPTIKADPAAVKALEYAGFKVAGLANNHIMDFGIEGLETTINACISSGMDYLGAGKNINDARKILYKNLDGREIAILNFAENEFSTTSGDNPGANPVDPVNNYSDIRGAKSESDYVFVYVHGGIEDYKYPSPEQKKLFRFYIDCGADAVVCSHSHCFSGYERYNEGLIFYGLGNYIFDWFVDNSIMTDSDWNYGYMVKFIITDKLGFEIIPYIQSSVRPGVFLLSGPQKESFFSEVERINSVISDPGLLESKFKELCKSREKFFKLAVNPFFNFLYRIILKFFPGFMFINKRKKLLLLNLVRCESHREVLINILNESTR